ncbi:MAG: hypothetical protein B7Z55_04995 [Planctomycetales bacterium 12-60-4]|nr:MAG: hypothetical protein B7Z55_04995 [Planctomycetales bacterium 12-60-4]
MPSNLILTTENRRLHMPAETVMRRMSVLVLVGPLVGDPLPDVTVYSPDGSPFKTADLRGQYTVLTFGCLTCPPSMWNILGLEAVQRDYGPKGVKFYFIFKALAHPELAGNYVQPFTLDERLALVRQAEKQFGTQIPWIVDAMDNRLKHAMGDRPNSQFLIDPKGVIVRKRAWANPLAVRKDLEELVGSVEHITREEDLHLNLGLPLKSAAERGVVQRIPRPNMLPILIDPQIEPTGKPFFAKLRAEADAGLLGDGAGKLYIGFHLDPLHNAHWNNLNKPLSFEIDKADGVKLDQWSATVEKVAVASDADPREFLLTVESWPTDQPLRLTVTYFACDNEDNCHAVKQAYILHRERDNDGGGARGAGAGYWEPEEFARSMLRGDRNRDGKLTRSETVGIVLPHYEKLDTNQDGFLDLEELKAVADWLNHHHQPGTPNPAAKPGQ